MRKGGGGGEDEDPFGGLDLLQRAVAVDNIELATATHGGGGDGGDAGGFDEMEEGEYGRFRAQFLETVSRTQTFSTDDVSFVLLQAVANHGDTAAAHAFLRRVCAEDLGAVMGHGDRQVLEHVLLPLALAFQPLQALRTNMNKLRVRAERSHVWSKAASLVVSAALECLVVAGEAHPRLPSAELEARVERVLSEDCPGLAAHVREHVLTLYRAAAPFARVSATVDALGVRLAGGVRDSTQGGGAGGGGGGSLEPPALATRERHADTAELVASSHPLLQARILKSPLYSASIWEMYSGADVSECVQRTAVRKLHEQVARQNLRVWRLWGVCGRGAGWGCGGAGRGTGR